MKRTAGYVLIPLLKILAGAPPVPAQTCIRVNQLGYTTRSIKCAVYHDDWADYSTNEPTLDGTTGSTLR